MRIETCTSYPDDLLEPHRPASAEIKWTLVISGGWSEDAYHSGHVAYFLAKTENDVWVLDAVARNTELDGLTQEDVDEGRLNDDQIQALWRSTTLEEAQASVYKRIVALCSDASPSADEDLMARALYQAVKSAGGRVVDDPDSDWADVFGVLKGDQSDD